MTADLEQSAAFESYFDAGGDYSLELLLGWLEADQWAQMPPPIPEKPWRSKVTLEPGWMICPACENGFVDVGRFMVFDALTDQRINVRVCGCCQGFVHITESHYAGWRDLKANTKLWVDERKKWIDEARARKSAKAVSKKGEAERTVQHDGEVKALNVKYDGMTALFPQMPMKTKGKHGKRFFEQ